MDKNRRRFRSRLVRSGLAGDECGITISQTVLSDSSRNICLCLENLHEPYQAFITLTLTRNPTRSCHCTWTGWRFPTLIVLIGRINNFPHDRHLTELPSLRAEWPGLLGRRSQERSPLTGKQRTPTARSMSRTSSPPQHIPSGIKKCGLIRTS